MSEASSRRPSQVTVAGWATVAASVLLVFNIFDTMGRLNSVDMRDEVTEALSTGSAKDLGIGVDEALEWIRWAMMLGGAAAAAAVILGYFVLQKHHGARIALTVTIIPIILCAPFAGGFLCAIVAASVAMLWSRPARDWFAGRPITPTRSFLRPPEPSDRDRSDGYGSSTGSSTGSAGKDPASPPVVLPPSPDDPDGSGQDGPPPTLGFGDVPAAHRTGAGPHGAATGERRTGAGQLSSRPAAVRMACVVSWVFSGFTALVYVGFIGYLVFDPDELVDRITEMSQWQDAGLEQDLALPMLWFAASIFLVWCLTAVVVTYFVWRRHDWARYLLVVSAAVAGLAGLLAFPVSIAHLVATASVIGLLFSQASRSWFGRPPEGTPGPP